MQPNDGGWRQRREQLRVGGGVRDEEEEEEEAVGVCGKGTPLRSGKRLDARMMLGAEKRSSAAWFDSQRSPMEICIRTKDACRQETRKSGRAPEGKHAGRSFSIQMSGDDVRG